MRHSLPAAIAAYGLSLGVAQIDDELPPPVYALLTGLNAATVGIVALAAVQLSQKAITDQLSRLLIFFGATAGMLYNALWYFPVIMFAGGVARIVWDLRLFHASLARLKRRRRQNGNDAEASSSPVEIVQSRRTDLEGDDQGSRIRSGRRSNEDIRNNIAENPGSLHQSLFTWKAGVAIIACFFVIFIILMLLRGLLKTDSRALKLWVNLWLGKWVHSQFSCI